MNLLRWLSSVFIIWSLSLAAFSQERVSGPIDERFIQLSPEDLKSLDQLMRASVEVQKAIERVGFDDRHSNSESRSTDPRANSAAKLGYKADSDFLETIKENTQYRIKGGRATVSFGINLKYGSFADQDRFSKEILCEDQAGSISHKMFSLCREKREAHIGVFFRVPFRDNLPSSK